MGTNDTTTALWLTEATSSEMKPENSTSFDPYEVVAFLLVHSPSVVIIDRAITPIWYLIGIAGNILSARIWLQRRMWQSNSSAIYLSAMSIGDLIFILLHIVQELKYAWAIHSFRYPVFCEMYYVIYMATQYLSPILVLCFTVERYIAVCHPFRKEHFCTTSRAVKVVVGSVVCCISLGLVQICFWVFDKEKIDCVDRQGVDMNFWSVWSWMTEMTVFLAVPVIILIFNIFVILEVQKVSKLAKKNKGPSTPKSDSNSSTSATTVMLLSVSFYVIITTLPATLVYVMMVDFPEGDHNLSDEQIYVDPVWNRNLKYLIARKIVDEICLSHYACNFILYVITGAHFRRSLLELFGCPVRRAEQYTEVTQKTDVTNARTTHF